MEAQMQERQRNLQQGVDAMMERIQKSDLGPKLKELYLCSARCFDTPSSNNQIQNCIQNCQQPIERNQQFMHEAMNSFQVRLQRCSEMCQDDAQQMVTPDIQHDYGKMDVVQNAFMKCSSSCIDKSISSLPDLEKRLLSEMNAKR